MSSRTRSLTVAAVAALALALSACNGGGSNSSADSVGGPTGDPVSGGTGRIIQDAEPRSLDPALIANSWASSPVVGNALYGELMIDDPTTGEVQYRIAKSFSSDDGGKTFTLTLRDDVDFSDGTPLTADDVKATWDHFKDPATASVDFPQASQIDTVTVVDPTTVKLTLVTAIPKFANSILQTGLNWIASATSIAGGAAVMDAHPVGAGAYTLKSWARQDTITLLRNPKYYGDAPYLDELDITTAADPDQRYNTVSSGGADLAMEGAWNNLAKAKTAGLQQHVLDFGGGTVLTLNNTKAPFDDVRARKGLSEALDLQQIDDATNGGNGKIPTTLFGKTSPFYDDIPLITHDPADAQKQFDALAADGKPLSFTFSVFPGSGAALGNAIQTQLSQFKNVKVAIKTIDLSTYGTTMATRDYDMIVNSITFGPEPEPRLWFGLDGQSGGNFSGVDDAQLNADLDQGRSATTEAERKTAYEAVQKRLAEIVPVIFYSSSALGYIAQDNVGGIQQYGLGSLLPETLWLKS